MSSVYLERKAGETWKITVPISDDIMSFFNGNLIGLVVESDIRDADRNIIFQYPMSALTAEQTDIVLTAPANATAGFTVGSIVVLDVRVHNGSANGHRLTNTYNVRVKEPITEYEIPLANQGSFSARDFSSDFRRSTET